MNKCLANCRTLGIAGMILMSLTGLNSAKAEGVARGRCDFQRPGSVGSFEMWKTTSGGQGRFTLKREKQDAKAGLQRYLFQDLECSKNQTEKETKVICHGIESDRSETGVISLITKNGAEYSLEWLSDAKAQKGATGTVLQAGNIRSCQLDELMASVGVPGASLAEKTAQAKGPAVKEADPSKSTETNSESAVANEKGLVDRSLEKIHAAKDYLSEKLKRKNNEPVSAPNAEVVNEDPQDCAHTGGRQCSGVNFILRPEGTALHPESSSGNQ